MIFVLGLFSEQCTICGNSSYPSGETSLAARRGERRLFFQATFISLRKWEGGNPGRQGVTWLTFCWVCAAGLSEPLPHYSLFCGHIIDPILVS